MKKYFIKIAALALVAVMGVCSLAACSESPAENPEENVTEQTTENQE